MKNRNGNGNGTVGKLKMDRYDTNVWNARHIKRGTEPQT